jgi:hypothetical protein
MYHKFVRAKERLTAFSEGQCARCLVACEDHQDRSRYLTLSGYSLTRVCEGNDENNLNKSSQAGNLYSTLMSAGIPAGASASSFLHKFPRSEIGDFIFSPSLPQCRGDFVQILMSPSAPWLQWLLSSRRVVYTVWCIDTAEGIWIARIKFQREGSRSVVFMVCHDITK